jgi:predicted GNAT family acetyltransferase
MKENTKLNMTLLSGTGRYWFEDAHHHLIGEIRYHIDSDNRFAVTHTYVDPTYRGQGIANQLLDQIINQATNEKKYIYPICSFAVKVLQHPKYQHLWDPKEGSPTGGTCTWIKR